VLLKPDLSSSITHDPDVVSGDKQPPESGPA
jgi:hypothetical protein